MRLLRLYALFLHSPVRTFIYIFDSFILSPFHYWFAYKKQQHLSTLLLIKEIFQTSSVSGQLKFILSLPLQLVTIRHRFNFSWLQSVTYLFQLYDIFVHLTFCRKALQYVTGSFSPFISKSVCQWSLAVFFSSPAELSFLLQLWFFVSPWTRIRLSSDSHRTNIVSRTTLYILCIYPVILVFCSSLLFT